MTILVVPISRHIIICLPELYLGLGGVPKEETS